MYRLVQKAHTAEAEKVFGYIRVSTETQVEKGYGLATQQKAIREYCKQHGLALVQVFMDGGKSGAQGDNDILSERQGLTDLLASLNGVRRVVVLNTSRLWRDDMAKVIIQRALRQAKADIISVEQSTYSLYNEDPSDFLLNGMFELLDQYERLSINLKLAKGRKTKARAGQKACGVAPLGYRWTSAAAIEIDPDGAELVKLIYTQYLKLGSIGKLKSYLDDGGHLTQRGNGFSKQALADILRNDFYKGVVTHGSVKTTGQHKPIINKFTFGRVQSQLSAGRRNYNN